MSQTLIDFTKPHPAYAIVSDATERTAGKSHGDLSYQAGLSTQKSYFFAFLDPQPNGAAFVSAHLPLKLTLKPHQILCLTAEGLQDKPVVFQLIVNTSASKEKQFSYQQKFTIDHKKSTTYFALENFSATYRGKPFPEAPPLHVHDIQSVGIRIIGRDKAPNQSFQKGLYGLALYHLSVCNA